jgi:hypothetical protein
MSWEEQLNGDTLAWLLERDNPGVHYLAMITNYSLRKN